MRIARRDRRRRRSICRARRARPCTAACRRRGIRPPGARYRARRRDASPSASNSPAPSGPASDLQVTQTSRVAAADRPLSAFMRRQSESAAMRLGANRKSVVRSSSAPWPPLRRPCGSSAHGRSPGSRRFADAAFPDLAKVQWRKASARRSQSRGRPRIGEKPTVFPFHPHGKRGTVRGLCSSFARGCQMERRTLSLRCAS